MEGITLFVSVIIIVFGILQIILFFKLWGMTNDVKKLVHHFIQDDLKTSASTEKVESSINALVWIILSIAAIILIGGAIYSALDI